MLHLEQSPRISFAQVLTRKLQRNLQGYRRVSVGHQDGFRRHHPRDTPLQARVFCLKGYGFIPSHDKVFDSNLALTGDTNNYSGARCYSSPVHFEPKTNVALTPDQSRLDGKFFRRNANWRWLDQGRIESCLNCQRSTSLYPRPDELESIQAESV